IQFEDISLKEALVQLKAQSGLSFTYSEDIIPATKKVSVNAKEQKIRSILTQLLKGTGIDFKPVGQQIILFKGRTTSRSNSNPSSDVPTLKKYTISGYISDEKTGEKLIGANVFLPATGSGASTNVYGFFSLTLPEGTYQLEASYVGYQTLGLEIKLKADSELNLDLNVSADLAEVEVVAEKHSERIEERTQMGATSIPVSQIQALPALAGEVDVLRVMQLLPGVSSGNDATAGLFVRGGSHDQNLILLDGVPIYNSFHLFGFVSVFNADAINKVELTKGGFPARYGGRLSSIVDIRLKEGNMNELKGTGTISPIATKLTLEGPIIKDKMAFIVSGRRTFADLFMRPISRAERRRFGVDGSNGYFFNDLSAKLNYKFSNKDRLYFSFFGGRDKWDDIYNTASVSQDSIQSNTNSQIKWG
ncbi:MAG: carboxypeptidase-like regulatory domain-containing protein, partial [Bacteroidota bacterium]